VYQPKRYPDAAEFICASREAQFPPVVEQAPTPTANPALFVTFVSFVVKSLLRPTEILRGAQIQPPIKKGANDVLDPTRP
jgi:hypothetical protein